MKNSYPLSLVVAGACLTGTAGCDGSKAASTDSTSASTAVPSGAEPRQVAEAAPQSRVSSSTHSAARTPAARPALNSAASRPAPLTSGNQARVASPGTSASLRMIRPTTRVEDAVADARVEAPKLMERVPASRVQPAPSSRRTDSATSRPLRREPAPPANLSTPTTDVDSDEDATDAHESGAAADVREA
jgi:hypothetical protein